MIAAALISLVLGDSIALGAGRALHAPTIARVGASSCEILRRTPAGPQGIVIVSAGSNDPPGRCVATIRDRLHASRVVWIAPRNPAAASHVRRVAASHGDAVVTFAAGRDGVHPRSYGALAASIRSILKR